MKWLALLSLFILVSADVNITSIPFVIPGADFVGYGYDIRYLATEHALRFPLVDWTFINAKAYSYPLNREDVYLVPDQLFVRTVARTDAESYVFSTVEEMQNTESQSHGLKADAVGEFDPLQWLPEQNRTDLYASLLSQYQGYPNATVITPKIKYESKSFSLGSEITNAKSALTKNENYYVRNRQVNQLYQLFLDKRPLRKALENDMQRLYNQDWISNKEAYEAFFERYGTHVVVSAMLGGAISLDSIVQRTAIQQITTSVQNFSQQENSTHVDSKNETVDDTLIRNSPLCNGTDEGYGYNPFKGTCELLPETWCYNPMTDILDEQFLTPLNNATHPWSATGPVTPPHQGFRYNCSFPPVPWCYWWWIFGWCEWRQVCNWVDLGPYADPVFGIEKAVDLPVIGCPGCNSIFIDTSSLPYARQRVGQYRDFKTQPNPQLITFFIYGGSFQADHGVVEIMDTRNIENQDDDIPIVQFGQRGNLIGFRDSPGGANSINTGVVMPAPGVWYEIRLVMNYTDKSCDMWFRNGTGTKWYLGVKQHKFFYSDTTDGYRVGRINLWNQPSGVKDYWSGFKFCNPLEGAPYKPLTTHTAVATTTAKFKQVVSGKLDTSFENTYNKFTLYQSNNWKLKGGDSSMVDLLNFRESTDVFEAWKVTIESNPAPVQFTLKEISQFFPDVNTTYGVSQRDLVKHAVTEFLRTETTLDPIIDTNLNDTIIAS